MYGVGHMTLHHILFLKGEHVMQMEHQARRPNTLERGQMWWADLPKDRCNPHSQFGLRPVVIISNNKGNLSSPNILVCPLTTQEDKYKMIHPNVMGANHRLSYVQCEQIKVLDRDRLGEYIGKVRDIEMKYIDRALAVSIDLIPYIDEMDRASKRVAELKTELDKTKSELIRMTEEVEKLRQESESAELGKHVRCVFDILMKDFHIGSSSAAATGDVLSVSDEDKTSSQPSCKADEGENSYHQSIESSDALTTVTSCSNSNPKSAIDRFNRRYAKYQQLNKQSNEVEDTENSKLGRPNAVKWTDGAIKAFVVDFQAMEPDRLINKYQLKSYRTAAEYYRRFKKGESL